MNTLTKTLTLLLTLLFACGALVACGGAQARDDANATNVNADETEDGEEAAGATGNSRMQPATSGGLERAEELE